MAHSLVYRYPGIVTEQYFKMDVHTLMEIHTYLDGRTRPVSTGLKEYHIVWLLDQHLLDCGTPSE